MGMNTVKTTFDYRSLYHIYALKCNDDKHVA